MKINKKNKQLIVLFSIILLLWLAKDLFLKGSGGNNANIRILETGRIIDAPTFDLPDIGGRRRSLDDFSKNYVLLNFWATW